MADIDDDLPPPPQQQPKKVVLPDSDEDDLPPPPPRATAPAAAPVKTVVLPDTDDDDDLPPPPASPPPKKVILPDSDDDLPPPPAKAGAAPAAKPAAADDDLDDLPPPPPKSGAAAAMAADAADPAAGSSPPTRKRTTHVDVGDRKERRQTTVRRNVNDISFEGFLFKQSPTWPYTSQKRWCVLKGRVLDYYENQQTHTKAGTLDLKGASLVDVSKTAKMPHNFGLTGPTGQLKSRVYIWSAVSREEYDKWKAVLDQVLTEPRVSELHWFDKMAQAIFQ